jgi:hypothetical protein
MPLRKPVAAALVSAALCGTAHAQVSRVFVSVNGNDANVCSDVATPCRTLRGGIDQVDANGEVIVIASGSYAGGTIAKSVRINVASGIVAFSGLPIVVDPGAGGAVVLRGLTLKAATAGAGSAITHQSGALFVENSVIDGWYTGLISKAGAEELFVKGSVFRNQSSTGLIVQSGDTAIVDDSFFERNGETGVSIQAGRLRVSHTVFSANISGGTVWNAGTEAVFHGCKVTGNGTYGLRVKNGGVLRVSHSTITHNTYGLVNEGATLYSYGNNVVAESSVDLAGVITSAALK